MVLSELAGAASELDTNSGLLLIYIVVPSTQKQIHESVPYSDTKSAVT